MILWILLVKMNKNLPVECYNQAFLSIPYNSWSFANLVPICLKHLFGENYNQEYIYQISGCEYARTRAHTHTHTHTHKHTSSRSIYDCKESASIVRITIKTWYLLGTNSYNNVMNKLSMKIAT